MSKNLWQLAMQDSFLSDEAQAFINRQNDAEERRRAAAADVSTPAGRRPTVLFTHRVVLQREQKLAVLRMAELGWNFYCMLYSLEDRAYALLARDERTGIWGILYPNGELDRERSIRVRRVDCWTMDGAQVQSPVRRCGTPHSVDAEYPDTDFVPCAREDFPSAVGTRTTNWSDE